MQSVSRIIITGIIVLIVGVVAYFSLPLIPLWLTDWTGLQITPLGILLVAIIWGLALGLVQRERDYFKNQRISFETACFTIGGIFGGALLGSKMALYAGSGGMSISDLYLFSFYLGTMAGIGFASGGVIFWLSGFLWRVTRQRKFVQRLGCGHTAHAMRAHEESR